MPVTRVPFSAWLACATLAFASPGASIARADDRSMTTELLAGLDPGGDDAVKQAETTLERATRMRAAGDSDHARVAEAVAKDWAELARDRARARTAEAAAKALEIKAEAESAHVERERALLEEAIARSGRLKAEAAELAARRDAGAPARNKTFVATDAKPPRKPVKTGGADASTPDAGGADKAPKSPPRGAR